jgi:probable HAF family extracellular repeat protein
MLPKINKPVEEEGDLVSITMSQFLKRNGFSLTIVGMALLVVTVALKMPRHSAPVLLPLQSAGRIGEVQNISKGEKKHTVLKFEKSNTKIDLGALEGRLTSWSVNSRYDIAYSIRDASGALHSFLLLRNGERRTIPPPPGAHSLSVRQISEENEVIGNFCRTDRQRNRMRRISFVWSQERGLREIDNPGGSNTFANAIHHGLVVGKTEVVEGIYHAFLWREGQPMQDLGVLPRGIDSEAIAVNAWGDIVGSGDTDDGASHGLLWRDGKIQDINQIASSRAGWHLYEGLSIDEEGVVIVKGVNRDAVRLFQLRLPKRAAP